MPVTTETLTGETALHSVEEEWRELWADSAESSPFQRYEWLAMCWRRLSAGGGSGPRLILVRQDGRLVLAAAMVMRKRFWLLHEMASLATVLPQYDGVLMRRDGEHAPWLRAFTREASRHPLTLRLCFDRVPARWTLAAQSRAPRKVYSMAGLARLPNGFEPYWASRSKSLRTDHRRQLRRMGEMGDVDFHLSEAATLDSDLDWLLEQKRAWTPREGKLRYGVGQANAESDLRGFCHAMLQQDALHLGMLSIGGRRVAGTLCFSTRDEAVCYLIAQDSEFDNISPGRSAMILTFEAAAVRGVTLLDFMGGASDWKTRLGTEQAAIEKLRLRRDQ